MALTDSMTLNGAPIYNTIVRNNMVEASLSMTTTQVSQLTITWTDPGWSMLESGQFNLGKNVDLPGFALEIAAVSSVDVDGTAGCSVDCRPRSVRALENRQGARVMTNVSASEFVQSECAAVGVASFVQSSARRRQVARDMPTPGQQEKTNPPSSWTTFSRLANEEGFIVFEAAGTVYFGRPSWLLSRTVTNAFLTYGASSSDPWKAMALPECHITEDDVAKTVSGELSGERGPYVRCPFGLVVSGMSSRFNGGYMLTSVTIDAMNDSSNVQIQGGTPVDPIPQPPAA